MTLSLRDEDRRALDLLLDHAATASSDENGAFYASGGAELRSRLHAAQKWLHMLDAMPAQEPPADLAARTLERLNHPIDQQPSQNAPDFTRSQHPA